MEKNLITVDMLECEARIAGYFEIDEINMAILESNGKMSFMPKDKNMPVVKKDLGLATNDKGLVYNLIIDGKIMKDNLKYILNNDIASQMSNSNGSTMAHITKGFLEKRRFVFPPFEEQQRIVNILDEFNALCNSITAELPVEIEERQKQYEYYRDKLLTFTEYSA